MYALIEREAQARELIEGVWNAGYVEAAVGSGNSGDIYSPIGTIRFVQKGSKIQLFLKGKLDMTGTAAAVADRLNWIVFDEADVEWLGHTNPNYLKLRGPVTEEAEELLEYAQIAAKNADWGAAAEYLRDSAMKFKAAASIPGVVGADRLRKLAARFMAQARRLAAKHGFKLSTKPEVELPGFQGPVVEDEEELVEFEGPSPEERRRKKFLQSGKAAKMRRKRGMGPMSKQAKRNFIAGKSSKCKPGKKMVFGKCQYVANEDVLDEAKAVGKVQQAVVKYLVKSDWTSVTEVARNLPASIHFGRIESAVGALARKGLLKSKDDPRLGPMVMLSEGVLGEASDAVEMPAKPPAGFKEVQVQATVKKVSFDRNTGAVEFLLPMNKKYYDGYLRDYLASVQETDPKEQINVFLKSGYTDDEIEAVHEEARRAIWPKTYTLPKPVKIKVGVFKRKGMNEDVLEEGRATTTKKGIKLKNGDEIPKGTSVEMEFVSKGVAVLLKMDHTGKSGRDYKSEPLKIPSSRLTMYVAGIGNPPSVKTMEKWLDDGVAKSVTGKRVEPDGTGPDGAPSWLIVLGMI